MSAAKIISENENVVRIMLEANDKKICDDYIKIIEDVIIKKGYAVQC